MLLSDVEITVRLFNGILFAKLRHDSKFEFKKYVILFDTLTIGHVYEIIGYSFARGFIQDGASG